MSNYPLTVPARITTTLISLDGVLVNASKTFKLPV